MRPIISMNHISKIAILVTVLMALSGFTLSAASVGIVSPKISLHPLEKDDKPAGFSITGFDSPALFSPQYDLLKYEYSVDSTLTTYIGESKLKIPFFARPVVMSFEQFRDDKLKNDVRDQWVKAVENRVLKAVVGGDGGALEIEIPWRVRSKTFQKIFGGDRVGLRVTGDITINGGLRKQKTDRVLTTQNDASNYSFRIDQTQRFNIEGKVGDKVSVYVDQDSERMFDFENALKLEYTGHEDEIIQKIEAGNVSLSLTGTQLATFSGTNKGLFGFKTESRFGPFKLTTIASVEKGQKNKKSLAGGAEEQTVEIQSTTGIMRNRYYFLDESYRENFRWFNQNMEHILTQNAEEIIEIKVYKSVAYNQQAMGSDGGGLPGLAMYAPDTLNVPDLSGSYDSRNNVFRYFKELETSAYTVDKRFGYLRLKNLLYADDVLAVSYTVAGGGYHGDNEITEGDTLILKLIRPDNPLPADLTWPYEFKNVYNLQASGIVEDGFALDVFKDSTGATDPNTHNVEGEQKTYLEIFGLDIRNASGEPISDGIIDINPDIISLGYGELILPGLRPFDPDTNKMGGYYIQPLNPQTGDPQGPLEFIIPAIDSTTYMPALYDSTSNYITTSNYVSKYYFSVKYANTLAAYSLGFNVLEGSEEVYLNDKLLSKGSGYQIDYMTGNLTILDPGAGLPTANVEVFWESGEIFQLDKKTLLGMRGEYELWNQESFIGGTALYLNEKPLEERVKLGNEPVRNFILDANTRMVFKPDVLTQALDFLPFIEADAESEIKLEGEIARIYPNPNPLNNDATGDKNGVAYLDDFESIKRVTSLGIMRKNWVLSSIPDGAAPSVTEAILPDSLQSNREKIAKNFARGNLIWYNPYEQVPINEIWPEREVNSSVASNVHVLKIEFEPDSLDEINVSEKESWGGLQRYLSAGYADQTKSKYLEIWLDVDSDSDELYLHVDLGKVSEDAIPNDTINTEDLLIEDLPYGNGILDPGEDSGLDMMKDNSAAAGIAGGDFWDLDKNGFKNYFEPYSNDNYDYNVSNKKDYSEINGTEGNENDEGERRPDSEDLDNDGLLDTDEDFFRCTIPMPLPDTLLAGENSQTGWQLVRFPLKYAQAHGSASWNQIEYARIWMDHTDEPVKVRIATIELVSNEWEEVFTTLPTGQKSEEKLQISVINTYDNPSSYGQPPGVRGLRDPITNILAREQSLVMKVTNLEPKSQAMIQKTYYANQDFLKYNTMKMFVYAYEGTTTAFSDSTMRMFFRFGTDTTSNYYEVYQYLKPDKTANREDNGFVWHPENEIYVDLTEIPNIKLERDDLILRYEEGESITGLQNVYDTKLGFEINDGDTLSIYGYRIIDSDSIVVKGNPSLAQIRQLTIGLDYRDAHNYLTTDDEVEIWLDELRLSEVKKDPGTAYRTSVNITLSDLGSISFELNEQEAGYYSLNERLDNPGGASGTSRKSVTGSFAMDRFLPPSWGFRFPLNGNYSTNTTLPKYYPGSDIELDYSDADAVESVRSLTEQKGWGVNFSKSGTSGGKISEYTLNKLSANYNFSESYGSNPTNEYTTTETRSGQARYNLTIPRDFGSISFMKWAQNIPVIKKFKDMKFNPMLTKIDLSISGTEQATSTLTRSSIYQQNESFGITRTFATGWKPFEPMSFDLNRSHKSDMVDNQWDEMFEGLFGRENNNTQALTASYAPTIFSWMTQDINYTSNYQWSWGSGYAPSGKSIHSKNNISFSATLKTSQIFKSKSSARGGSASRGRQPRGGRPGQTPEVEEGKKDEEDKKKVPNPLTLMKAALSKLNDIRFDFNRSRDLGTPAVNGQAGWKYQLGLSKNPEIDQLAAYSGSSYSTESYTENYDIRSGINFTSKLRTTFDYNKKNTESYTSSASGNYSSSQFYLFSKKDGSVNAFPFVNYSARLTGLEKTALFEKYTQSVSLETAYSGKTSTNWNNDKSDIYKRTYERNLSPLVGLNITWKGGISSNFQLKKTQSITDNTDNSNSRSSNTTISITGNYNRKTGFRVPIPVWPFKNKRFENNTTFSMTFTYSNRIDEIMADASTKFTETQKNNQWSVTPKIDYTFSNTVTGGVHYEMGATNDKLNGKTSFYEFGFNVRITIRGR